VIFAFFFPGIEFYPDLLTAATFIVTDKNRQGEISQILRFLAGGGLG